MPRYRLDEPIRLTQGFPRNKLLWLERIDRIKGVPFSEDYRQVSLIKLFKLLPK